MDRYTHSTVNFNFFCCFLRYVRKPTRSERTGQLDFIFFLLGSSLVFSGCSNSKADNLTVTANEEFLHSNNESIEIGLQGNVEVKVDGTETIAFYTFKKKARKR